MNRAAGKTGRGMEGCGCVVRANHVGGPLVLQVGWGDALIDQNIGREGCGLETSFAQRFLTPLFSTSSSNRTAPLSPSSLPAFEPAFRLDSQLFGFPLTVFFQTVSRACFLTLPELHGKPLRFAFKVTSATCFPGPLTVVALLTQRFTHWHCTLLLKEFQGPSRAN